MSGKADKISGVYLITNPENKKYIGASIDIYKRWEQYFYSCCDDQSLIYSSLKKHGVSNHKFEILVECSENELSENETKFSKKYDVLGENGLNCRVPYSSNFIYDTWRKETKEKLRNGRIGYKMSEKSREKLSNSKKGIIPYNAKIIINIETGIFYDSIRYAELAHNMAKDSLRKKLRIAKRNKTNLRYA